VRVWLACFSGMVLRWLGSPLTDRPSP
jgi:hypothetical protein